MLLAIDTSTDHASVALNIKGVISHAEHAAQHQHTQLLLPMIDKLLVDAGIHLSQLDGIVFGRGPGSFTGLRITCSLAKALAYAHDLPLFPISSLAAIANNVIFQQPSLAIHRILVMIDARMNQVYWACYDNTVAIDNTVDYDNTIDEYVSYVSDISINGDSSLFLAGVGYSPYWQQLPDTIRSKLIGNATMYPNAAAMLRLVLHDKQPVVISAAEALPVYLRNIT